MGIFHTLVLVVSLQQILFADRLQCAEAAKILVYGAVGTHSVRLTMFPMMEALAARGHKVTYLSAYDNFEDPHKKSNITYVTPTKWKQTLGNWEDHGVKFFDARKAGDIPRNWLNFHDLGVLACQTLYSDPEFTDFVKESSFDLVIMESVVNECALGLVHLYKSKLIVYASSTAFPWFADTYGFPDETSTITEVVFNFRGGNEMSFIERVQNALSPVIFALKREYDYFPTLEEITRKAWAAGVSKEAVPSFREIERKISLVLLSTHATLDLPRSLPPHIIPVGGAVVSQTPKPLSKEMEKFAASAKSGLIFISFGTATEFANFGQEVRVEFIKALASFPEIKFLWKASLPINETMPSNVMVTTWAPQQTVLAHPNTKAFISHCGMGSMTEAIHFAVPVVMIPVLAEQDTNVNVMESRGVGVKVEILTLKSEELTDAISEVLTNDKYRLAMKKLSDAFKDRIMEPIEHGIWWIEYVLRHDNSNDYLVTLSVHQPWWKRRQVDVWLFIGASLLCTFLASVGILYLGAKLILKRLLVSSTPKNKKSKKKVS